MAFFVCVHCVGELKDSPSDTTVTEGDNFSCAVSVKEHKRALVEQSLFHLYKGGDSTSPKYEEKS